MTSRWSCRWWRWRAFRLRVGWVFRFCHVTFSELAERAEELQDIWVVKTTWDGREEDKDDWNKRMCSVPEVKCFQSMDLNRKEQIKLTIGGVKELLQSSWLPLQFLVLVSLQDHLEKVKLFDQPGFWAALALILLQERCKYFQRKFSILSYSGKTKREEELPPTVHRSPSEVLLVREQPVASWLPVSRSSSGLVLWTIAMSCGHNDASPDVIVTCLLSPVFLRFTDVVCWSNISHDALCHVMNQRKLYAPIVK